nr:uncharacterized protein LOC109781341 isoform X2 [Aegilops tauschii subsp. strangulata]
MVRAAKRPKVNLVQTESNDALMDEIVVPRGTLMTCIAGMKLQSEDVGAAIQFLEFCRSFGEICKIGKGQPEETLRHLTELQEVSSVVADVHINLLSVIENGKDNPFDKYPRHGDEWIRKVGEYISLTFHAEDFTLQCLNQGVSGYRSLNPSCKLEVLNCLCDEALSCEKLRTCIDNKDRKCVATQEIKAATRKQKELKRRYDDMTKTIEGGDTANNEEANDILSQIKEAEEVKQAAQNVLCVPVFGEHAQLQPLQAPMKRKNREHNLQKTKHSTLGIEEIMAGAAKQDITDHHRGIMLHVAPWDWRKQNTFHLYH